MHDIIPTLIHETDRPALIDLAAGWELSGADLRAAVDRLGGQLAAAGTGPGDGVGIAMPNSGATVTRTVVAGSHADDPLAPTAHTVPPTASRRAATQAPTRRGDRR